MDGDPIPSDGTREYIEKVLVPYWTREVVDLCVKKYVRGKRVTFDVYVREVYLK